MDRTTLAPIASHMMDAALRNLVNDGHVAFATMIIKDNANKGSPCCPEYCRSKPIGSARTPS